ncbi:MAG: undecaprenyl-phosphate glucose phosphotransferase [Chitinophagaceae bacterium]|nr:undecaprenyl-phosphate glucose phosphotransferase [Chitinophagaceae bacterium]
MNNSLIKNLKVLLCILDLLVINMIMFTAEALMRDHIVSEHVQYTFLWIFVNVFWLAVSLSLKIYGLKSILSFEVFTKRSMRAYLYFFIGVIFYLFILKQQIISRSFMILILTSIPISLLFNRFLYLVVNQYLKSKELFVNKIIILGYNDITKKLIHYLEEDSRNRKIIGFCEEYENVKELTHYPVLGKVQDVLEVSKANGATEIFSTIAPEQNPALYKIIQQADDNLIRFKIIPDFGFFVRKQIHVDYLSDMPVLSLRKEPLEDIGNRIKKRIFDIVFSVLMTIFILSWLIPIISFCIWITSGRPIFFIQKRSGRDNKIFGCIKFRSMQVNHSADEKQATKNDSRVTPLGRFLRKTSLDEFPQFLNVLGGDMSVVGPRPHMLKHTDAYSQLVNQYMVRQFLKPGITGWAQINGYRGEISETVELEKRVECDIWYLENWSLYLDLKIIFLTALNMLKGEKKAY